MASNIDLLRGTLDLLVLRAVKLEPNHGLGIARRVGELTRGTSTCLIRSEKLYWRKLAKLNLQGAPDCIKSAFLALQRLNRDALVSAAIRVETSPSWVFVLVEAD